MGRTLRGIGGQRKQVAGAWAVNAGAAADCVPICYRLDTQTLKAISPGQLLALAGKEC